MAQPIATNYTYGNWYRAAAADSINPSLLAIPAIFVELIEADYAKIFTRIRGHRPNTGPAQLQLRSAADSIDPDQ